MDNNIFKVENIYRQPVTIEEIKNNIDEIDTIVINGSIEISDEVYDFNSKERPITYSCILKDFFGGGVLSFDKEYYITHKEEIDSLIKYICEKRKKQSITIKSSDLINDELIETISKNSFISDIYLGSEEDIYYLNSTNYEVLKNNKSLQSINTKGVAEDLSNNFDSIISYNKTRKILGNNNYDDLQSSKVIIKEPINANELKNIRLISPNSKIRIVYDDYVNVIDFLKTLKANNQNNEVILSIHDKVKFNKYLFSNLELFKDVIISIGTDNYSSKMYYEYEKYLTSLIEPAMDLSPFEKFLYAYNITKKYKKYNENQDIKDDSRNLYKLLDNEYMVCVGFSKLLIDLLNKLGIAATDISTGVDVGFDNVDKNTFDIPDDVNVKRGHHARVRLHLIDPKYGIDGLYFSDPTWDNNLDNDSYLFSLMTAKEYDNLYRKNYVSTYDTELLYTSYSLEEFYKRVNYLLDSENKMYYRETTEIEKEYDIIMKLVEDMKSLDSMFFNKICISYFNRFKEIYNDAKKDDNDLKKEFTELFNKQIEEIGNYIISKNNNLVSGKVFEECIRKLYLNYYGFDNNDVEQILQETMEYNKNRYKDAFPNRKEMLKDGSIVDLDIIDNKFDIQYQKIA